MSQESSAEFGNYSRILEQTRLDIAKELFQKRMLSVPAFAELLDVHLQMSAENMPGYFPSTNDIAIEPYIVMPEEPANHNPYVDSAVLERVTGVKVTRKYIDETLGVSVELTDDFPIFNAYKNTSYGEVTADTFMSKAGRVVIQRRNNQAAMASVMPDDYDETGAPLVSAPFSVLTEAHKVDMEAASAFRAAYAELYEAVGATTILDPETGTIIVP